jgi:predicted RNA-binding Zn-ribbon protein involved in translation (DUF1610 family)
VKKKRLSKIVIRRRHIEDAKSDLERFNCHRCKAVFDTDELLQEHRQYQHGEYKVNDPLRYQSKVNNRPPPPVIYEITIIRYKGTVYRYVLGMGLYLGNTQVCDEDSDFYREVIDYVSEVPYEEVGTTFKVKYPTIEYLNLSESGPFKYKTRCKNCGFIIKTTSEIDDSNLLCPRCGKDVSKKSRRLEGNGSITIPIIK